jgi:hypothetical protein
MLPTVLLACCCNNFFASIFLMSKKSVSWALLISLSELGINKSHKPNNIVATMIRPAQFLNTMETKIFFRDGFPWDVGLV